MLPRSVENTSLYMSINFFFHWNRGIITFIYYITVDRAKYVRGVILDGESFPSAPLLHDRRFYHDRSDLHRRYVLWSSDQADDDYEE